MLYSFNRYIAAGPRPKKMLRAYYQQKTRTLHVLPFATPNNDESGEYTAETLPTVFHDIHIEYSKARRRPSDTPTPTPTPSSDDNSNTFLPLSLDGYLIQLDNEPSAPLSSKYQFIVYDTVETHLPFEKRLQQLHLLFPPHATHRNTNTNNNNNNTDNHSNTNGNNNNNNTNTTLLVLGQAIYDAGPNTNNNINASNTSSSSSSLPSSSSPSSIVVTLADYTPYIMSNREYWARRTSEEDFFVMKKQQSYYYQPDSFMIWKVIISFIQFILPPSPFCSFILYLCDPFSYLNVMKESV